jgi:hypothetical protein
MEPLGRGSSSTYPRRMGTKMPRASKHTMTKPAAEVSDAARCSEKTMARGALGSSAQEPAKIACVDCLPGGGIAKCRGRMPWHRALESAFAILRRPADARHRQPSLAQGRPARNSPRASRRPRRGAARLASPLGRDDAARASHRSGGAGRGLHDVRSPDTQANDHRLFRWATNCPEYTATAVPVLPSNGPSRWQEDYEKFSRQSRRIASVEAAE